MSCAAQTNLVRSLGTAFKADCLGNQTQLKRPSRLVSDIALIPCGPKLSCRIQDGCTYPVQYEAGRLDGFMASQGSADLGVPIRVTKSVHAPDGIFSIGVALSTTTWENVGFLLKSTTGGPDHTVALVQTTDVGVSKIICPTGIMVDTTTPHSILIAGQGLFKANDGTESGPFPSMARVCVTGCEWTVSVQVGNGDNGDVVSDEVYYDLQPSAYSPFVALVVGEGVVGGGPPSAVLRTIDIKTLLPVPVGTTTAYFVSFTPESGEASRAVTVVSSSELDMIVVGVQILASPAQSVLWPLQLNGDLITPLTLTGFNNPSTGFLRLPDGGVGTTVIKVLADQFGSVYAVCTALGNPASPVANHFVAVYAFNTDTDPLLPFGSYGIARWWDVSSGSTRPNDALLNPADNSIVIVGNHFATEVSDLLPGIYAGPPCLPWLQVHMPAATAITDLPAPPVPFMVKFGCAGLPCVLLNGLPNCPCATLLWASSLVHTVGYNQILILGDADVNPLGTAQPAGVLAVQVALTGHGARVLNCGHAPLPVITTTCSGVVTVDAVCAPTTLVVNGPVVVGSNDFPAPLPGSIKFEGGFFSGYDGTEWLKLAYAPPPTIITR